MNSVILCLLISFFSVVLSRVSIFKKFDPIIIAYFCGAIFSFLMGTSDPKILKAMIGASIAIGFPILIMGTNIHSLLKIRLSEFLSMTLYALIISVISIGTISFIGKNDDFSAEVLLISSSFIGSSPNLFLSAFLLDMPTHIQLRAQILDWIGSSCLFIFLMLLPIQLGSNRAKKDTNMNPIYPQLFTLIPKAVLIAIMCFFIRESIREELKDFASLISLVTFSLVASVYTDKSLKRGAIKLSSLVFVIYAAAVGMLFDVEKLSSLSKLEIFYPTVLIVISYSLLNLLGRFIAAEKKLSVVVVSSSVLSPMIAALVISKLRGEEQIPLSLRLSIMGLLSACFYSLLIHYVVALL